VTLAERWCSRHGVTLAQLAGCAVGHGLVLCLVDADERDLGAPPDRGLQVPEPAIDARQLRTPVAEQRSDPRRIQFGGERNGCTTNQRVLLETADHRSCPTRGDDVVRVAQQDVLAGCRAHTGVACMVHARDVAPNESEARRIGRTPDEWRHDVGESICRSVVHHEYFVHGTILCAEGLELHADGTSGIAGGDHDTHRLFDHDQPSACDGTVIVR
jgi:hypothetical protein